MQEQPFPHDRDREDTGFKPFLDEAKFKYGQLEPDDGTVGGMTLTVERDGISPPLETDAVAIHEFEGETVLCCFVWRSLNAEKARESATERGIILTGEQQDDIEELADTEKCILTNIIPWREVSGIELGGVFKEVYSDE